MEGKCTINSIKTFRKDFKRHLRMSTLFVALYFFVIAIGGLLFFYIEHCYDVTPSKLGIYEQRYFNMCHLVQGIHKNQTHTEIGNVSLSLIASAVEECERRKHEKEVPKCELDASSFYKWFDYCGTVCYTIGYGKTVTRSSTGRIVTIFYAIPGIATAMTMNIFIGNTFIDGTKILFVLFYTKLLKRKIVQNLSLKVFFYQIFLTVVISILYAVVCQVYALGNTSFTEAIYFTFVTFSTIGFGDIVYETDTLLTGAANVLVKILGFATFFAGMGVTASVLAGLSELFTKDQREARRKKKPFVSRMMKKVNKVQNRSNTYQVDEDIRGEM